MKDIRPFLIFDTARYGKQYSSSANDIKYKLEINEIDSNPYYIPFGDKTRQWELTVTPQYRDPDESEEYYTDDNQTIRFKMSRYGKPSIEDFSQHIFDELNAILNAIGVNDEDWVWDIQQKIITPIAEGFEPQEVFNFIKNIHKDYSNTQDFLNVHDDMHHRMRQSLKFAMYLLEGNAAMFSMTYQYPIGEHLTAFLEIGKMYDHYE
jgi:hypothetical protein